MSDYPASPVPPSYDGQGQGSTQYPAQGAGYGQGPATAINPGKTLGIVGLILGIVGFFIPLASIAGLICSILGLNKSKRVGQKNGIAVAGIIVSIVALIVNIIGIVVIVGGIVAGANAVTQCQNDPTGTVEIFGQSTSCEQFLQDSN